VPDRIDLAFAALFSVVGAVLDYFVFWPRMRRAMESGVPRARIRAYRFLMVMEWLLAGCVWARWLALDRTWAWLGLAWPEGWRQGLNWLVVAAVVCLLVAQTRSLAKLSEERRVALRPKLEHVATLLPRTSEEHLWFVALSVTAGVCEELLYRGFLIWVLRPSLGLWLAAGMSVLLFGAAHSYQGAKGTIQATVMGVIFSGLTLLTGSILGAMAAHALVDILGGTSGYQLLRESPTA